MRIEAAWQLIRRDAVMLDYYKGLTKRMKGQDAIVRVARKLLHRIRAVLLSGSVYVHGVRGELATTTLIAPVLRAPKKKRRFKRIAITAPA